MSTLSPSTPKSSSSWLDFLKRPSLPKKSAKAMSANALFIPQLISAQAQAHPQAPAIIGGDRTVCYYELENRAHAIARCLQSSGVKQGAIVPVLMERSEALAATALGIMKAGAAYLPLDPAYPEERMRLILDEVQAPVLLTSSALRGEAPRGTWKTVQIEHLQQLPSDSSARKAAAPISSSQVAYVIFTSGSTGRPKGVEITHGNLCNLVQWHVDAFGVSTSDRATLLASPGFDAAVWEIWPYLAAGASVYVVDDTTRASARALRNWILSKGITISFVPTPVAQQLIFLDWPVETPLRYLLTGADILQHYPPADLPFTFVNNYGPTECTVVATSGVISAKDRQRARPSIGRAITNTRTYVLGENLNQVPTGAVGELYISGANVGRGYFRDAKLTSEKFLPNPFDGEPGSRFYKTGDLVRLLPSGELEFVGRTDDQIKIHGHRIEPDEVSTALCRHAAVQSSVVVGRKNASGEASLVAYVMWNAGYQANASELREHLRALVPDYMIPNTFVAVNSFALTTNGKIDRSALPEPDAANTLRGNASSSALTQTEEKLSAIVSALLNVANVNANDNFFLLGGHSLLGAQLLAQIHNTFHLDLTLRTLFDNPTVTALSAEIERNMTARANAAQV